MTEIEKKAMTYTPRKGDRVIWRKKPGEVVDDYWAHRDRFSVLFDGDREPLDFGAEALRLVYNDLTRFIIPKPVDPVENVMRLVRTVAEDHVIEAAIRELVSAGGGKIGEGA